MPVDSGQESSPALDSSHLPGKQDLSVGGLAPETASAPLRFRPARASFYIDGFNLYHGMEACGDGTLKWLDIMSLCRSFLLPTDVLADVIFFTAFNTWDKAKRQRHVAYVTALQATGVKVHLGSFDRKPKFCWEKDGYCRSPSEKKTDVGIAVTLLGDGFEDRFDKAFLISADSDHVPLADRMHLSLPAKKLFLIAPPNRLSQATELSQAIGGKAFHLTPQRLREHPLAPEYRTPKGALLAARPAAYGRHR